MTVFRASEDYPHWPAVAVLIHRSFAYMTPLLGHPAGAVNVTPDRLVKAASLGAALIVEDVGKPVACLFTRPSRDFSDALYLGWLAVEQAYRQQSLAFALVNAAEDEARTRKLAALTLDTGRELGNLHVYFQNMGFQQQPDHGAVISFRKCVSNSGNKPQ